VTSIGPIMMRGMEQNLRTPGPTPIPPAVREAQAQQMVDHRGSEFAELLRETSTGLAELIGTEGEVLLLTGSGSGALEAAVVNTLSPGDRVLSVNIGSFGDRFAKIATVFGTDVTSLPFEWGTSASPDALRAHLADAEPYRAVLITHNETSTGVSNPLRELAAVVHDAPGDPLLLVDGISGLGAMPFEMDAWGIDVAMSGSQKGLMAPPGLGFVAANDRAREVHKKAGLRTPYWDWTDREGDQHYQKYAGTPPEHLLFGLRAAMDMLFAEGLDNVFHRHRLLAEAVRRAVGIWGEGQAIGFNIVEPSERCDTVTAVLMNSGHNPEALRAYCNEKCGVILGHGIGDLSGKAFRVAHMGHVNAPMILGTLSVIEMALNALEIPHGKGGAQAAIDWLGQQVKA
jgi:alanine-glyoxylate transaminase/serine-glyoxylate transaminase/serine-pyruvate transaminase